MKNGFSNTFACHFQSSNIHFFLYRNKIFLPSLNLSNLIKNTSFTKTPKYRFILKKILYFFLFLGLFLPIAILGGGLFVTGLVVVVKTNDTGFVVSSAEKGFPNVSDLSLFS